MLANVNLVTCFFKASEGLASLIEAFSLRENCKFHDSKMTLCRWLQDHTENGHSYYAFGKEASLDSIVFRILEKN